ncbi:bifunctional 2-polyprenyl-6-hydroxyphenol methylase/3-demethylubiquinol 3-O-methyltransferase UbiG [Methanoregula sp. PtaU1.Bin006]|nr:class I SAM-dependent methyltransferase [Methanoregula sp. PtaU1.Bin006]
MEFETMDWNGIWKDLYNRNVASRGRGECATIWESRKKAEEFLARSREDPGRIENVIDALRPAPESRILDIGAGPGTLAVPLARLTRQVTAVEPAAGMADVMEEYALGNGIQNLKIVRKRWEDIDPAADLDGPYDIVFASHSLGMPDIRGAVGKMAAVASGRVFLFWFGGITSWEKPMVDLWPQLHGREYQPGPKVDVLFNVLWSMGICPNVEVGLLDHTRLYPDIDAALADLREQFGIANPEQEDILRKYLESTLVQKNGQFFLPGTTTGARLWWDTWPNGGG